LLHWPNENTRALPPLAALLERWPAGDIDRALAELLNADIALKESRVSSEEDTLASLVLALCGTSARQAA